MRFPRKDLCITAKRLSIMPAVRKTSLRTKKTASSARSATEKPLLAPRTPRNALTQTTSSSEKLFPKTTSGRYELIITEKPSSAKKVAEALANSKPIKKTQGKIAWWELTHGEKDIVVASAVGHLYGVVENKQGKKGWTYPVFDVHWNALEKTSGAQYLRLIERLAKNASEITVATDYDIEGEVIGYTILSFGCKREDGNRMKYSTVTVPDLQKSYANKADTINWGQAMAGKTRHELDWYYGINLSRALTLAVKSTGGFKILSSGRVQGPALKIIVEKEKEIAAFISEPYWELTLPTKIGAVEVDAMCADNPFSQEQQASDYRSSCTGVARVAAVDSKHSTQAPPHPFDLTTLQTEAYRSLRINPKETLRIAQDLYTGGYTSYPRTSSQQLPLELGLPTIIKKLGAQDAYKELATELLKRKNLAPNNGPKTDPAHPAIFPTGVAPARIQGRTAAVYDLIVRRFLATFSDPAIRKTQTVTITKGAGTFLAKGTHTIEPGWHRFYGRHVKLDESVLPAVVIGTSVSGEVMQERKMTQPPRRYTPASIIKELEKRGLGTKATRADIVDNLYDRGYVDEQSITASELGLVTVDTLEQYAPEILDEHLTREIEDEIEKIRTGEAKPEQVLEHARTHLTKTLEDFKKHEQTIGKTLAAAERVAQDKRSTLGPCPCGGTLQIRIGRFGRFIGCNLYPQCTNTFGVPQKGLLRPTLKQCEHCKHPIVKLGSREYCINTQCAGKPKPENPKSSTCPKCGKPLALRASFYGQFWGCSSYPKCRYIEVSQAVEEGKEEETS
jgi:DNA topoisomerase-1